MEYEIDNDKQEHFVEVMVKMKELHDRLFPDTNAHYFFEWNNGLIKKVFYFWDVEDEEAWNDWTLRNQSNKEWLDFVINEYHPPKFVTPNSVKFAFYHEVGQKLKPIDLAGVNFSYNITENGIERVKL